MPSFPSFARAYSLDNYSYEFIPDIIHTDFNSRNTRQRTVVGGQQDVFSVSLFLSDAELSDFEAFVQSDLDYRGLSFDGPYYVGDVEYTGTLRIISDYSVENIQNQIWRVSYDFELLDRDMTNEDHVYDVITDIGSFSTAESIFLSLDNLVNNVYE